MQCDIDLLRDELIEILDHGNVEELKTLILNNHAVDIASLFSELDDKQLTKLLKNLDLEDAAALFEQADEDEQDRVCGLLEDQDLLNLFTYIGNDDVVDIISRMNTKRKKHLIQMMKHDDKKTIARLLGYPDDSAGGIMNTDYIALKSTLTLSEAIIKIKEIAPKTEVLETIFIINDRNALIGECDLRDILSNDSNLTLYDIMNDNIIKIYPEEDQSEASTLVSKYDLNALPVVSHANVLLGIITLDDIIDVIEEEYSEDISRMAGMGEQEEIDSSVLQSVKLRLPWLLINLVTAFIASSVVSMFDGTIDKVTALAVAMPIASGMGGNAGTQTLSVLVRAITLKEIDLKTGWTKVFKQVIVGIINGIVTGFIAGLVLYFMYGNIYLGLIICLAMIGNLIVAGIFGFLVPLILDRFNMDPALGSSIFVTTATDCFGFLFFLGLATLLIKYLC